MSTLEFHPLADIFPLIDDADFDELVADIKAHGLHEPIAVFEDKILDGRNRYRACMAAGVPCPTRPYEGNDPVGFVVSLNLKRRHLSESQRAMVAAKLATFGHGGDRAKSPIGDLTQAEAAELLNVGKRSVERAGKIIDHGDAELISAVERGEASVSAAAEIADLPSDEQREAVAGGEKAVSAKAKKARAAKKKKAAKDRGNDEEPMANPLIAAWAKASLKVRREFLRARWTEIMKVREQISPTTIVRAADPNGSGNSEDRWIEG
jgi:ParB-like chromosome segregation protein Spo0J